MSENQTMKRAATVVRRFQDAPQYRLDGIAQVHEVGEDVSHFDEDRLKDLEARGNVMREPAPKPDALSTDSTMDSTMGGTTDEGSTAAMPPPPAPPAKAADGVKTRSKKTDADPE